MRKITPKLRAAASKNGKKAAAVSAVTRLLKLAGKRFGRLIVETEAPRVGKRTAWHCVCDCGQRTVVLTTSLQWGNTKSCGCLHRESVRALRRTHGGSVEDRRLYRVWTNMRRRCLSPRTARYASYGGRGIRVCDRWLSDFAAFREDMGPCPKGHSLDRIDVDGHYEPGNCRWADDRTQRNNMRSNVRFALAGDTYTIAEAARAFGINYSTLHGRLRSGCSPEEAIRRHAK